MHNKTYENHPHNKPHDHVMGWRQYRGGDVMVYRLYIPRGKNKKTAAIMQNMIGPPIGNPLWIFLYSLLFHKELVTIGQGNRMDTITLRWKLLWNRRE